MLVPEMFRSRSSHTVTQSFRSLDTMATSPQTEAKIDRITNETMQERRACRLELLFSWL